MKTPGPGAHYQDNLIIFSGLDVVSQSAHRKRDHHDEEFVGKLKQVQHQYEGRRAVKE